jgi:hypothetical protein
MDWTPLGCAAIILLVLLIGAFYRPSPPSEQSGEDSVLINEHFHCEMFGVPSKEYDLAQSAFGGAGCSDINAEYERRGLGH